MKFHKNFHLVALFATMIALNAQAAPVESAADVVRAVSAWAAANGSAFATPGSVVDVESVKDDDGATVLYWIAKMSNGGAVIASPDTDLDLVIAVLERYDGSFPAGHPLPSILKKDMRNRLSIIRSASSSSSSGSASTFSVSLLSATAQSASTAAELPDDVKESVKKANAQWEKYGSASAMRMQSLPTEEEIAPYVRRVVDGFEKGGRFTHWNQSSVGGEPCYNYHTPEKEVCGCVATAGAAVMQFFGNSTDIKETGPVDGVSCSLWGQSVDKKTLPGAIDWSVLPKSYGGASDADLDEIGRELLGRVTYNFGVLVGMGWAKEGPGTDSGSYVSSLAEAFKKYGFDTARAVTFNTVDDGTSQYFKMVYAQNWAGAPVVLGIQGDAGGHAVVACGYAKTPDDEELCRVFMGWGGFGDAWYRFPNVESFTIVDEAVTMIGYNATSSMEPEELIDLNQDGINNLFNMVGTVPICGKSNLRDAVLKFPGVTKSEGEFSVTLTTKVDENGFFAVRIPANTEDLSVVHEDTGTVLTISPFDSKVLSDEKTDRPALEAAMPGEMLFLVLNTTTKSTVASAHAKALEDGKAVLMVSGSGSVRENLLVDYITYLDSTTDMSNKFVFVRLNSSDYSSPDGDGDPSIGVFDPAEGSAELRWWESNGRRLAYSNFIDYDADNQDGLNYLFTASDATALTNIVNAALAGGYDQYARRHSGIEVVVRAIDEAGNAMGGLGGVDLAYGVHTNCWTNGQVVVFSAPDVYTNEVLGIAFKCLGWVTNGADLAKCAVTNRQVELSLNGSVDFAWLWKTNAFRVVSSVSSKVSANEDAKDAVTPAVAWVCPRDRVTVMAKGILPTGAWGLNGWDIYGDITGADNYSKAHVCENGRAISFSVYEPTHVTANYSQSASEKADPVEYSVGLSIDPPELADLMDENASLSLGENDTVDKNISLAPYTSDIVDSTGGVWKCVGYVSNGVTNSIPESEHVFFTGDSASLQLVWELQEPEEEPVVPEPGPISVKGLSRGADGTWSITVEGAVKDCWYWLYAADDISELSGSSDSWTASKAVLLEGTNPQKATADGDVVFRMAPSSDAMFWRVKATGTGE